jgi:5'-3' exonuclease
VFDGGRAPQKDATNEDRQARRAIRYDAYENGVEGAEGSAASTRNLHASVSITDEMVSAVVEALRQHGLAYYIAPLEADGQLARLWKSGRFGFLSLALGRSAQDPRPKIRDPKFLSRAERREPQ